MWFKNLSLYRLPVDFKFDAVAFQEAFAKAAMKPIGPLEPKRMGFVPVVGDALYHAASNGVLIALGTQERILPATVVAQAVADDAQQFFERTGRRPGKKMHEQIKDKVRFEMLPKAFVRNQTQLAYFDFERNLLLVNAAGDTAAECICTELRLGFGSFTVEPVQTEESVSAMMSAWLVSSKCDGPFVLGDECELKDPVDAGCAIKAKRQDLGLDEIREHARTGKKVSQLALLYDNRLSFVLDEKFKLRKLKFLDIILDEIKDTAGEDEAAELDTRFTLQVLEFRRLIGELDAVFKLM